MPQSEYRSKITQTPVNDVRPTQNMPVKSQPDNWQLPDNTGPSLWLLTGLTGLLCMLAFMVYDAVNTVMVSFSDNPVTGSILAVLLGGFVLLLTSLVLRELTGYRRVNRFVGTALPLDTLAQSNDPEAVDRAIHAHASLFASGSYAHHCYRAYQHMLNRDQTCEERVRLYRHHVSGPVVAKANEVVRRESLSAGSLAFISPNPLIQTLAVLWISLRTIRRVASVYGLRPGTAGNWSLLKILAQNIAAQSVFDMASDEVVNQISGSLSAKVMENTAEAVAAGALNVRLGKAMIKLMSPVK
ncbi:YcjF family protein [Alteromonas sp. CYL-A6]|uniref:YcjF family protein n=1 Tax=Alteromonas nitratireducens TaxID=3390813 RepID=UPI0034C34BEE